MNLQLSHMIYYVENVQKSIDFFTTALGIPIHFAHESGCYVELKTGETKLAFVKEEFVEETFPQGFYKSSTSTPLGCAPTLTTRDLEQVFEQCLKYGAEEVCPPTKKPWGQTVAYIRDPNGVLIELATPME